MYRLPSQFDPTARHDGLSAAGGGSTTTTCSSCVVTLGVASFVTAQLFVAAMPRADAEGPETAAAAVIRDTPEVLAPPADAVVRPLPSRRQLMLVGLFSLVIAGIAGLMSGAMTTVFLLSPIVGLAVFIALYCWAFERTGRSPGRGALIAVAVLVGAAVAGALEMWMWLAAIG
ncbi:MAG: hypothetical protein ACJ8GV_00540 [Luteimonas sp.]